VILRQLGIQSMCSGWQLNSQSIDVAMQSHLLVDLGENIGVQLLQRALQLRPIGAGRAIAQERPRLCHQQISTVYHSEAPLELHDKRQWSVEGW